MMDVRERLYAMCISEDGKVSAYVCMYVCILMDLSCIYIPLYVCIYFSLTKTLKFMYVCMNL